MSDRVLSPAASRRRVLGLGLAGAGVAVAGSAPASHARARLPLTAQTTEGPYYFDPKRVRADITEGRAGVPLEVRFTVLGQDGAPLPGALVDIWHCDAAGHYSGYAGQGDDHATDTRGQTFLRGRLAAGADGVAAFTTLYPGWYRGRTTHIHFKVLTGSRTNLTSQFFLPDALSEFLYTSLPAYRRAGVRDTLNSVDGIALQAGETVIGSVREAEGRYIAALTVVVDPAASPDIDRPPVPGEGMPPGLPPGGFPAGGPPPGGPPGHATLTGDARIAAIIPVAKR